MNDFLPSDLPEFADRVAANQRQLSESPRGSYDFIVCGAGAPARSSHADLPRTRCRRCCWSKPAAAMRCRTVWTRRVAAQPRQRARLGLPAEPNPHLNGRAIPMSMGKVLGGGSSINVMVWARGHRSDWDFFAEETGDQAWGYDTASKIYRRSRIGKAAPDPRHRGTGGPVWVQPARRSRTRRDAMLGRRERDRHSHLRQPERRDDGGEGGCAITDMLIRNGRRHSIYPRLY